MKKNVKVVTGASYGDEGKGLMTAYFSEISRKAGRRCLNILHNGGAQRGHTVNMKVSNIVKRHIFHHLGSGSFNGADSYFSEDFILNPVIFAEEMGGLGSLPIKIYRNKNCRWSTPFDMMINQIAEDYRGENRHGSCGAGIWETILRYETLPSPSLDEFAELSPGLQRDFLREVREYAVRRLREAGMKSIPEKWREIMNARGVEKHFLEDTAYMRRAVTAVDDLPGEYTDIVFEGGQGLLLSESLMAACGSDRHLTPSLTGHENPVKIMEGTDIESLEVCYVTRSYLTRHGAGPFPGECPKEAINPDMTDLTNLPNDYQGSIRYGRIDTASLNERISSDFSGYGGFHGAEKSVAVTHLNETGGMLIATGGSEELSRLNADRKYLSRSENIGEIEII